MLVVEIVERLRQLKRVFGNEGGFLRGDRRIHGIIKRAGGKQQFPQVGAVGLGKALTGSVGIPFHRRERRLCSFAADPANAHKGAEAALARSEEHTADSSHGYSSYALFCLQKQTPI